MDGILEGREDYATELSGEVMATLWDSFMAIFHSFWYRRSGWLRKDYFVEVIRKNLKIHVCKHPEVTDYIDTCCKKIAVLLSSNALQGFQMNMIGPDGGIVQRFVFTVHGRLDYTGFNRDQGDELLQQIRTATQQGIRRFFESEKSMKVTPLRKFQIVLGLTEAATKTYESFINGPFHSDPDVDTFPWSKPRVKKVVPLSHVFQSAFDVSDSTSIRPPHVSVKENSPTPDPMEFEIECEPGTERPIFPFIKKEVESQLLIPVEGQPLKPHHPQMIPIHSMRFGGSMSICMGFYSLSYKKEEANVTPKTNNRISNLASEFSRNKINSPGEYRSGNLNQSPRTLSDYFSRKDSPSSIVRTPPEREIIKSSVASPTSSTPPSLRAQRTSESARSLKEAFEEALRNDSEASEDRQRLRHDLNSATSPRGLNRVTLTATRRIPTARR